MKLFSFSVLFLFLISIGAQEKPGETSTVKSVEDELLLEDDQVLLPEKETGPEKKTDADTVAASETKKSDLKTTEKVIENDEELILDDAEEYLLAPSVKSEKKKSIETVSDSADTSKSKLAAADSSMHEDSAAVAGSSSGQPETVIPRPQQIVVQAKSTKIENSKTINFAHNLKQYRSPKLAMLFSFILPGSGQLYARHKLKAAIFGAAELAIISTGVGFRVKGKNAFGEAMRFADNNYDIGKFQTYYDSVFNPSVSDTTIRKSFFNDKLAPDEFLEMAGKKNKDFYEYIKGNEYPYVRGWNDVTPQFGPGFSISPSTPGYRNYNADSAFLVYPDWITDSSKALSEARFGFSKLQKEYERQSSRANSFYSTARKVFFLLMFDRVISAVDAGITARAYNYEMLGKQSFWQRINIEQNHVNTGTESYSGYSLVVRF